MEKKLFVNTIIAAYNAQAVNPELMFGKAVRQKCCTGKDCLLHS